MKKYSVSLIVIGLVSAASAFAAGEPPALIGGTVHNRTTREDLGLICKTRNAENICDTYQFVIGSRTKDGKIEIASELGPELKYSDIQTKLNPAAIADAMTPRASMNITSAVGGVPDGIYNSLNKSTMTGSFWYSLTDGFYGETDLGVIWRLVLGVAVTPIIAAGDALVYGTAGVIDVAQVAVDGTYVGTHNMIESMREHHIKKKVRKAVSEMMLPIEQGGEVKVSANVFERIVAGIR